MKEAIVVQGRRVDFCEIERIGALIHAHPEWSRRRLSEVLAREWNWRNGAGRLKDMATRSLLLKLQTLGLIELPARRRVATSRMSRSVPRLDWDQDPIRAGLAELEPLAIEEVSRSEARRTMLASALDQFHYLGWRGPVGENLQYVLLDAQGRLLSGLLFGAAAWKCRARDGLIGWSATQRCRSLHLLTNNTRFLVLPWVEVPHLASWFLSRVLGRLSADWQTKYGHPIVLVETFVEAGRFAGTCYRAANWRRAGATTGRTRQDRDHTRSVPIKDIYLYPLVRDFRRHLAS